MRAAGTIKPWLDGMRRAPWFRRGWRLTLDRAHDVGEAGEVNAPAGDAAEGGLTLHTADARFLLRYQLYPRAPLGRAMLGELLSRPRSRTVQRLLLAPYIAPAMAERLRDRGVAYFDLAGNCHLPLGTRHFIHVEGCRPLAGQLRPVERSREAGYQVLFALAARPALVRAPVRELARLAGTGKTAAAAMLTRLARDGLVTAAGAGSERRVLHRRQLIERWTHVYLDRARDKWSLGRYRLATAQPAELEARLTDVLDRERPAGWGFGGGAAAARLTKFYRGTDTVVQLQRPLVNLPQRLRALPDREGPLLLMAIPIPLAFDGALPYTVHPLLVYSELLASNDERALAAAERVRQRYLEPSE